LQSNDHEKYLKDLETSYRAGFGAQVCEEAMADLREFCHATKSAFSNDPLEMARLIGRKEVYDRIMTFLKVDYDNYFNITTQTYNEEDDYDY